MNLLFYVLAAIAALGVLILLHEAGHFFAARFCGMRVHEFAIGFGPRLFGFRWNGTDFTIRAIFLGGYVRIAGMHPSEADAQAPDSFLGSAAWKRLFSILAGPLANYITAFVIFIALFVFWGVPDFQPKVSQVPANTPLAAAGLLPEDKIQSVDGKPIRAQIPMNIQQLFQVVLEQRAQRYQSVSLSIARHDKLHEVKLKWSKELSWPRGRLAQTLGLFTEIYEPVEVAQVLPGSLAARVGIQPGDRVLRVGKKEVLRKFAFLRLLRDWRTQAVTLELVRAGARVEVVLPKAPTSLPTKGKKQPSWDALARLGIVLRGNSSLRVRAVKPGSLAQAAGIEKGDTIGQIEKEELRSVRGRTAQEHLQTLLARCTNKALALVVKRGGTTKTLTLPKQSDAKLCTAGTQLRAGTHILVVSVTAKSEAQQVGLRAGDLLFRVGGHPVRNELELVSRLKHRIYKELTLEVERGGKRLKLQAPVSKKADDWRLGFHPYPHVLREKKGWRESMRLAALATWRINVKIGTMMQRIFRGREKAQLGGPVEIINQTRQAAQAGFFRFFEFVAIISIHLAFFNLLPIPALDGGRVMFLVTQQVGRLFGFKDEVGIRIETIANVISFVLLFGLLILITFKDIYRLLFG